MTSTPIRVSKRRPDKTCRHCKKAEAGELVLLRQDEARFSIVPTWRTTLGVQGHRPVVGNLDYHDVVYIFGALNLVSGQFDSAYYRAMACTSAPEEAYAGAGAPAKGVRPALA
jgi:hypothetical protein